jgi:hypothetical protein
MPSIDFPEVDLLGPKPSIDTPELLTKQIGILTVEDLRRLSWTREDEPFVQACLNGEKGPEIQQSRLMALLKIDRIAFTCKYPETIDAKGHLKTGIGGKWEAARDAEFELQRLLFRKLEFEKKQ